ncbi:hypothetical protein LEP1GSC151_5275 [Leptospira interrogans serovar Grippotyphosa str. LT2186]|uniref:Uncharacterized protein n=1 Tax=Leptospira interrogans serovar Grippotyphosa str. LT2186 TaxID=1001599 RepID=M3GX43_LEPIR|nr:hypothetical protein LEP1GSC151_5275 [Leptospira interrogans serovar Grippotyphosa str. LT2186]
MIFDFCIAILIGIGSKNSKVGVPTIVYYLRFGADVSVLKNLREILTLNGCPLLCDYFNLNTQSNANQ